MGMQINSWRDAELAVAELMTTWGLTNVETTGAGADGGIDVTSVEAVAQVKAQLDTRIGRPEIQQLYGVAQYEAVTPLFFSIGGYSEAAEKWGSAAGVALFKLSTDGTATPLNSYALTIMSSPTASNEKYSVWTPWPRGRGERAIVRDIERCRIGGDPTGVDGELTLRVVYPEDRPCVSDRSCLTSPYECATTELIMLQIELAENHYKRDSPDPEYYELDFEDPGHVPDSALFQLEIERQDRHLFTMFEGESGWAVSEIRKDMDNYYTCLNAIQLLRFIEGWRLNPADPGQYTVQRREIQDPVCRTLDVDVHRIEFASDTECSTAEYTDLGLSRIVAWPDPTGEPSMDLGSAAGTPRWDNCNRHWTPEDEKVVDDIDGGGLVAAITFHRDLDTSDDLIVRRNPARDTWMVLRSRSQDYVKVLDRALAPNGESVPSARYYFTLEDVLLIAAHWRNSDDWWVNDSKLWRRLEVGQTVRDLLGPQIETNVPVDTFLDEPWRVPSPWVVPRSPGEMLSNIQLVENRVWPENDLMAEVYLSTASADDVPIIHKSLDEAVIALLVEQVEANYLMTTEIGMSALCILRGTENVLAEFHWRDGWTVYLDGSPWKVSTVEKSPPPATDLEYVDGGTVIRMFQRWIRGDPEWHTV